MLLFTLITLGSLSLTRAANLPVRQRDSCQHNNCYRAVWGNDPNLVPVLGVVSCERHLTTTELIYPLVTSTFAEVTLTTTTVSCITPTSSSPPVTVGLMYGADGMNALTVVPPTTSITTTVFGAVPTSVTGACDTGNYRSACSCKSEFGITSETITLLSTTSTSYITATFTNTLTTGPACPPPSSSIVIPSSSTSSDGTLSSISSTSSLSSESSSGSSSVSSSATITSASSSVSSTDSASSSSSATISSSSSTNATISSSASTGTSSSPSSTGTGSSSSLSSTGSSASGSSTFSSTATSSVSSSDAASFSSTSSANITSTAGTTRSSSLPSSSVSSELPSSSSSSSISSSSSTISNSSSSTSQSSTLTTLTFSTSSSGLPTPTPICTGNGVAVCNGSCQDLRTSNDHCGVCGNKCSAGKACTNGVCTSTACDSNCELLRLCNNSNNGTSTCACAKESEGSGVCFDSAKFKCIEDDPAKPQPVRCSTTASCSVGFVCVKEFCACTGTTAGICVSTEGCGVSGAEIAGPLVGFGEMMGRSASLF